jgi:hypothetical protein
VLKFVLLPCQAQGYRLFDRINSNLISIIFRAFQFTSSFILTMTNATRAYCEESSVHGFCYIVNRKLHAAERVLWILALICSIICCGLLTYKIGVKFKEDAMVTYTSDDGISVTNVNIWSFNSHLKLSNHEFQIPFASVTYCPDLESHNNEFDFNQIVSAIKNKEVSISNLTESEFVVGNL